MTCNNMNCHESVRKCKQNILYFASEEQEADKNVTFIDFGTNTKF